MGTPPPLPLRLRLAACCGFALCLMATTTLGQARAWLAATDGLWLDPTRWSPADAPDTASEAAAFGLTGSYTTRLDPTATTLVGGVDLTDGEVTLATSDLADALLTIAGNATVDNADWRIERDGLPNDVSLDIAGNLDVDAGGRVRVGDGGSISATSTAIAAGTSINATRVEVLGDAIADLGEVRIASTGGGSFEGSLTVLNNAVVTVGPMTVAPNSGADRRGVVQILNGQLTQSGGSTLVGSGGPDGEALIIVGGGGTLQLESTDVLSTGEIRNQGGHTHFDGVLYLNGGSFDESGETTRSFGADFTLIMDSGAEAVFDSQPLSFGAGQQASVSDARLMAPEGVELNGGLLLLHDGAQFESPLTIGAGGTAQLQSGAEIEFSYPVVNDGGSLVVASGATATFAAGFSGDGLSGGGAVFFTDVLDPGTSIGQTTLDAEVELSPTASLLIELAGASAGEHDRVIVTGHSATLDGHLAVTLIDGYTPSAGDEFTIFGVDNLSGGFATASVPALPEGMEWRLATGPSKVTLSVVPAAGPGDFNADGVVDAADFTVWRESLGASGPLLAADGDGSGAVDQGDLLVWQSNYGSTQPPPSAAPEPHAAVLAALGLLLLAAPPRVSP